MSRGAGKFAEDLIVTLLVFVLVFVAYLYLAKAGGSLANALQAIPAALQQLLANAQNVLGETLNLGGAGSPDLLPSSVYSGGNSGSGPQVVTGTSSTDGPWDDWGTDG